MNRPSLVLVVAARMVRHGFVRSRFLARNLKHSAPDRHELDYGSMGPLRVAVTTMGWAREQYVHNVGGAFTELDGAAPSDAALRRRIATTGEKYLALTFDDGPSEFTPEILQVLSIHDVRATFFVLGENAAAMPEVVRSLVDAGHGVAIHGWNHSLLTELDPEVVAEDLCRTQGLVRELSGAECRDVRPPYGVFDEALLSCFDDRGLVTWLWTADARDGPPMPPPITSQGRSCAPSRPAASSFCMTVAETVRRSARALPSIIEGLPEGDSAS